MAEATTPAQTTTTDPHTEVPKPDEIPFKDPESAEVEFKISKDINAMPEEVRDRFKALKVLTDRLHDLDEEEDKAYRAIERKYELLYQKVYAKRAALVKGDVQPEDSVCAKFEEMKGKLVDEGYEALEVPICDVKDIQNTTKGVSSFWLRAMLAHTSLSLEVTEKDRQILAYLEDVKLELHEEGYGYTLTFTFESNSYFAGTEFKKTFVMTKPNVVEKCIGTPIEWAAGCDPSKEKKKKKVKQNGKQKTVTTTVKCDSFFNFFETIEASELDKKKAASGDSDSDDEDNKIGEQMDHDFDMGNDIKDDIVPLALEYYLGVIEKEEPEDSDEDGDDDSDDEKPKKSKKPKVAPGGGPKGPNGEECKQQ